MSLSPTSLALRNGNGNTPQSGIVTVSFQNATNTGYTVAEVNGSNLTVSKVAFIITIASRNGASRRGNFLVRVTPSASNCGGAQDIAVSVSQ